MYFVNVWLPLSVILETRNIKIISSLCNGTKSSMSCKWLTKANTMQRLSVCVEKVYSLSRLLSNCHHSYLILIGLLQAVPLTTKTSVVTAVVLRPLLSVVEEGRKRRKRQQQL